MQALSRQQLVILAFITLAWGINWPVMKLGVTVYPPLTFRTLSMWLGLPVLALGLVLLKVPFRIPRASWRELLWLSATNMFVWHVAILFAVRTLSSGRSAILGYTMPIFSAVLGALVYQTPLPRRAWGGVGAAALGVLLLLWHELTGFAGRPWGVLLALVAAATWALGTQELRRTRIAQPALTIAFWMTVLTTLLMTVLATVFESSQWRMPDATAGAAILYNAVLIFGFAQAAWIYLARNLPPVASTLSVMLIPVLGVFSGAVWLHEALHWQDWAAVGLMVLAIATVLWPGRRPS
ncbi:DMT family transporter [Ramlibacter sp. G-1-2-2]|uniref:DMT family transporter n=1 Tax=Ramlibacter agri TaxID=2728837 RepID=A0A848GYG8_9BURK|nr:DMT family transporter [Ramlibacter agri]NML42332.1 DMT family transporter [Ramlibacter agri]